MPQPIFEVRAERPMEALPHRPEPWMVPGRTYLLVLRRWSSRTLPEAEVRDVATGGVLGRYSWPEARRLFGDPRGAADARNA